MTLANGDRPNRLALRLHKYNPTGGLDAKDAMDVCPNRAVTLTLRM